MTLQSAPLLDQILETWREALGEDMLAYRNHCYRVLHFCRALCDNSPATAGKLEIAVAFHDLGIWVNHTFDYLAPSKELVRTYLVQSDLGEWSPEIEAMIEHHHRLRPYKTAPGWLVEPFRRADWIDVTRGGIQFGLSAALVREILTRFPNAGFHKRLFALTWQRFKSHPLDPLPMMRW